MPINKLKKKPWEEQAPFMQPGETARPSAPPDFSRVTVNPDKTITTGGMTFSQEQWNAMLPSSMAAYGLKPTPDQARLLAAREQQMAQAQQQKDIQAIIASKQTQAMAQAQMQPQVTLEQQQIAAGIGQLSPEQQAREIDVGGRGIFGTAATLGAGVAGALVGGKMGAGLGTLIAPGPGTLIGAAAGGIIGFTGGIASKLTYSNVQKVSTGWQLYQGLTGNIDWTINEVNAGRMSGSRAEEMYDESVANLFATQRLLKRLTQDDLSEFLSPGAIGKLARINSYIARLPEKEFEVKNAVRNPDPTKIIYSANEEEL